MKKIGKCVSSGKVAVLLFLLILAYPVHGAPSEGIDDEEVLNVLRDETVEKLGPGIREDLMSSSGEERVEVVIRLEPQDRKDLKILESEPEDVLSSLKTHSEETQAPVRETVMEEGEIKNSFWISNAFLAEVPVKALDRVAEHPGVWRIHENFKVEVSGGPGNKETHEEVFPESGGNMEPEAFGSLTWGLERINVTGAWEKHIDGSGVRVAVSDTGVDIDHPDLEGKMLNLEGDDHYVGGWIEFDEYGDPVKNSVPHDTGGHGTHVSGTVLGGNESGTYIGVAPEADLMHALNLPDGEGTFAQVIAGMEWKAEPHDDQGTPLHEKHGGVVEDYRAHVASMSWGVDGYHEELEEPILNMVNSGVVPVASAGNEGHGTISSPSAVYEAFSIGASDVNDEIASFSSGKIVEEHDRNDVPSEYVKPDFAAPGVDVLSSVPGDSWGKWDGTSMAAPHVAGTVALMLRPGLSLDEIYTAMNKTADYYQGGDDLGDEKNTRYGHGIINTGKAVYKTRNLTLKPPTELSQNESTIRARVLEMPAEEVDAYFRYRKVGEEWEEVTAKEGILEAKNYSYTLEGLENNTDYEYKAIIRWNEENETTYPRRFRTHADIGLSTLPAENVTRNNATVRGKVEYLYTDQLEAYFRYRKVGEEWENTEPVVMDEPGPFQSEVKELENFERYEYKAVVESEDTEFVGETKYFETFEQPEWCDEENAYIITEPDELQEIRSDMDGDYILAGDVNASKTEEWYDGKGFEPIGDRNTGFNGSFDGRGYVVSDLYIERTDEKDIGLFGGTEENSTVKNVTLADTYVHGKQFAGGLVGWNVGEVKKSHVSGSVKSKYGEVGGLVGWNVRPDTIISRDTDESGPDVFIEDLDDEVFKGLLENTSAGRVLNSSSSAEVQGGSRWTGGLVGRNSGDITGSHATGNVYGQRDYAGGLSGNNFYAIIMDSYATGDVSTTEENPHGLNSTGGLVGSSMGYIVDSYATGDVSGNNYIGGLVGQNRKNITSSYATGNVSGVDQVGGFVGQNAYYSEYENKGFEGLVNRSYSVGKLSGVEDVGGLIGSNTFTNGEETFEGTVMDSYWDNETSGAVESDGGEGLKTDNMKGDRAPTNMDALDFEYVWETVEEGHVDSPADGYPILRDLDRKIQILNRVENNVTNVTVVEDPHKLDYIEGQQLDLKGMEIEVEWIVSDTENLSWPEDKQYIETDIDNGTALDIEYDCENIKVWHSDNEDGDVYGETAELSVEEDGVQEINIKTEPRKEYTAGEELDLENMAVELVYRSGHVYLVGHDHEELENKPHHGQILSTGDGEVVVNHTPSGQTVSQDITVEDGAFFSVNIDEGPDEVVEGDDVEVDYTVENRGNLEDAQAVNLTLDGTVEDAQTVDLDGGETYSGNFVWDSSDTDQGVYTVELVSRDDSDGFVLTVEEDTSSGPSGSGGGGYIPRPEASVETYSAEEITHDSALLRGKVTRMYELDSVDVYFRWRKKDGDWRETEAKEIEGEVDFDEELEGLDHGTDYEFKAVVRWDGNEDTGKIKEFSTDRPVPRVSNRWPEDGEINTGTDIFLAVDIEHVHGHGMSVEFRDEEGSTIERKEDVESGEVSARWTDLENGELYRWHVVVDDGWNTVVSETWEFTTGEEEDILSIQEEAEGIKQGLGELEEDIEMLGDSVADPTKEKHGRLSTLMLEAEEAMGKGDYRTAKEKIDEAMGIQREIDGELEDIRDEKYRPIYWVFIVVPLLTLMGAGGYFMSGKDLTNISLHVSKRKVPQYLEKWIEKRLDIGYSPAKIKEALDKTGRDPELVDRYLKKKE